MHTVFIAGATGYTGRHVVEACTARGLTTVAHVRPDSSALPEWRDRFQARGALVDTSDWTPAGMREALARHRPDVVFSLLGTTAKRARRGGGSYEEVDFGLTVLLLDAAADHQPPPLFVYLSAAGAGGRASNAYMEVRARVERAIRDRGVPHLIARPSFITGADREEDRPAERIGAALLDGLFGALAAVGIRGPARRWGSMTGGELGEALVTLAVDEAGRGVVEADGLRAAASESNRG